MFIWSLVIDIHESNQHKQTACQCVDEELNGNSNSVFSSPDQADEIDRNQCHLPEQVEQKSIQCSKYSNQCHLHHEHEAIKISWLLRIAGVGRQNNWRY